jgi:hypothetical protein
MLVLKKIFNLFALVFLFCFAPSAQSMSILQQRFTQAQMGDFIVTAQENHYSVLFIRSITSDTLLLEEISIPEHQIDIKKTHWKDWVFNKAPGHTSWTLYEIDRKSGKLIECFSYSKNGWLYLDESEQFLIRLLTLHFDEVPEKERKKIGPSPAHNEEDRRALWNPPLVLEGKRMTRPSFDVLKAQWPDDGSRLGHCSIELYFAKATPDFPFPYWLEVQSPHYAFKMRTIDSGHSLFSPIADPMPHRLPQILGLAQKGVDRWKLSIKTPLYFQKLHLFVVDLTGESKATLPIPSLPKEGPGPEELILEIATADLKKSLQEHHRYQWVLIPEGSSNIRVESEEIFTMTR